MNALDRFAALLAPLVFSLFVEVSYFSGIMRPDLFGLAVQMAGLCVLCHRPDWRGTVLATCLLLLSIYIKPNLLAGPLAAVLYLTLTDRRRAALSIAVPTLLRFSLRTCSSKRRRSSSIFILSTSSACAADTAVSRRPVESKTR